MHWVYYKTQNKCIGSIAQGHLCPQSSIQFVLRFFVSKYLINVTTNNTKENRQSNIKYSIIRIYSLPVF